MTVVAHEVDGSNVLELLDALTNPLPATVMATVIDEDDLVGEVTSLEGGNEPRTELFERTLTVVDRHHYGYGGVSEG